MFSTRSTASVASGRTATCANFALIAFQLWRKVFALPVKDPAREDLLT